MPPRERDEYMNNMPRGNVGSSPKSYYFVYIIILRTHTRHNFSKELVKADRNNEKVSIKTLRVLESQTFTFSALKCFAIFLSSMN